ncbi:MAG: hypothetical protein LBK63_07560 [Treponema sp.]|jgi:hypothetical protein|nr:hypothetical protein [Treponema sp.]
MAKSADWLPAGRDGILAMTDDWILVCGVRQTDWNIPCWALTELATRRNTARTALETVKNETAHTPAANAQCKEAFEVVTDFMQDFKRRYFLIPPLFDSDLISLGLKSRDTRPTPSPELDVRRPFSSYRLHTVHGY